MEETSEGRSYLASGDIDAELLHGDLRVLEQTEEQLVDGVVKVRALFLCVDCARRRTSTSVVDTRTDFDGEDCNGSFSGALLNARSNKS